MAPCSLNDELNGILKIEVTMLRIFRVLTKGIKENIAIDIIKSFENIYFDGSYKIYHHDKLLNNLISVIEKTINLNEYSKLKWKEKNEAVLIIIKAIHRLEKNSENSVPPEAWAYKNDGIKGMQMMNFDNEGWNYYNTWSEMKFPDVFYKEEMRAILQNTISNAMNKTKFNVLLINEKQLIENKSSPSIKKPSETKDLDLIQTTTPGYLSFNLYPKLDKTTGLEKQSSNSRLYPDLDGYDLTPSILKL